jgi:transposase-like protein
VDDTQDSKRRHCSPHKKVTAVKRHLLERVPISAICGELTIAPDMPYQRQPERFENTYLSFETDRRSQAIEATKDRKIEQLESELRCHWAIERRQLVRASKDTSRRFSLVA